MQIDKKQIIEIVGIVGVIASLIFVGMQLMLDRRVAMAAAYSQRADAQKEDDRIRMQSEDYLAYREKEWNAGIRPTWWNPELQEIFDDIDASPREIEARFRSWNIVLIGLDNIYYQYEQGLLEQEYWDGLVEGIKDNLRNPFARAALVRDAGRQFSVSPVLREIASEMGYIQ